MRHDDSFKLLNERLTDRDFVFVQDNQAKMWNNYLEESKEECVMNMN